MLYDGIKPESFGMLGTVERAITAKEDDELQLKAKFLRPYCVAFFDQLILQRKKKGRFVLSSSYPTVNQYLRQVSFEHLKTDCAVEGSFPEEEIIKVRRFYGNTDMVERAVLGWLSETVRKYLPEHSDSLWKDIVENYWEIVHNALLHSECEHGVSTCGQYYPKAGYFELSFYDAGVGIPYRVKKYFKPADTSTWNDEQCIAWALERGNSTQPINESAGLGLHLLREFLTMNHGVFQIISGYGYFGQESDGSHRFCNLRNSISGTLVNIRVIYDNHRYQLSGEMT